MAARKRQNRKAIIALLTSAMIFSLAGCGSGSDTRPLSEDSGEETAKALAADAGGGDDVLTVWCEASALDADLNAMCVAKEIYQKDHPDFELDVVETSWEDIQTKIIIAAASDDLSMLPDILLMQDNAFQKNVISFPNVYMDLTDSGIDFSQFAFSKTAYSVVEGRNYGVPFDNNAVVACYRTDDLAQVDMTIEDFTDITFDQYLRNGKKVLEATGKPLISVQSGEYDLIMMMLQSAGISLFHEDRTTNIVNNDTLKTAMETYKELKDSGVLIEVDGKDKYLASLASGDVAGTINGCWIMPFLQKSNDQKANDLKTADQKADDQKDKWVLTNMPRLPGDVNAGNYAGNGGSSWAVTKNCKDKAMAVDFLASTFAGSTKLYDDILPGGTVAAWIPAGESDVYSKPNAFFGGDAAAAKVVDFSTRAPAYVTGVYFYEGRDAVTAAITNYINGVDMDVELQTAADTVYYHMMQ